MCTPVQNMTYKTSYLRPSATSNALLQNKYLGRKLPRESDHRSTINSSSTSMPIISANVCIYKACACPSHAAGSDQLTTDSYKRLCSVPTPTFTTAKSRPWRRCSCFKNSDNKDWQSLSASETFWLNLSTIVPDILFSCLQSHCNTRRCGSLEIRSLLHAPFSQKKDRPLYRSAMAGC